VEASCAQQSIRTAHPHHGRTSALACKRVTLARIESGHGAVGFSGSSAALLQGIMAGHSVVRGTFWSLSRKKPWRPKTSRCSATTWASTSDGVAIVSR